MFLGRMAHFTLELVYRLAALLSTWTRRAPTRITNSWLLNLLPTPFSIAILVAGEDGVPVQVHVQPAAILALESEGPLDPVVLDGTWHTHNDDGLLVLDWYQAPWVRTPNGDFLFRERHVRAALQLALNALPLEFTRLVDRIGLGELDDLHAKYQGVASFMLFLQARVTLLHRITLHIADELYPADPIRLRANLCTLNGRLDPVSLFQSARNANDGLLMLLAASHAVYISRAPGRPVNVPPSVFTDIDDDTIRQIRACAALVAEVFAGHLVKGRFQHFLLDSARCDLNSISHLHGWRPWPMIAPDTTPPVVSLGCNALDTYGTAPMTAMSLNKLLASDLTGIALRTRLAALQATYPGRRGPCYQAALRYMLQRTSDAMMWGIFPAPSEGPHGYDEHPCEDTRLPSIPRSEAVLFPCISCKTTITDFVRTQTMTVAGIIRDMFDKGSANYFGMDIPSLRWLLLRQPGITNSVFVADLEHVFDDVQGPYSHPNLAINQSVDLPWSDWNTVGNGGWGGDNGW